MPKVGEWWYCEYTTRTKFDGKPEDVDTIRLLKIVGEAENGFLMQGQKNIFFTSTKHLLCKWKPNWIQKLFGYR